MAILFALIALAGWGVGDLFGAISSRLIGAKISYFWAMLVVSVLICFYIPFAGPVSDWRMFGVAIVLNLIHMFANVSGLMGLEVGNAAIVGTLSGTSTVLTILISLFLFGERLSILQSLGVVLVIGGGLLVSLNFEHFVNFRKGKIFSDKGIPFAIGAMLGWGIYFSLVRIPAEKIGWFWAGFPLYPLTLLLTFFIKDIRKKTGKIIRNRKILASILAFAIIITSGDFAYNIGILHGFTSIVAPIADSYPVLFVLLAEYVFKERLNIQQKWGIATVMSGIIVIALG